MGQGPTAGTRPARREAGKVELFPAAARRGGIGERPPPGPAPPAAGKLNPVLPRARLQFLFLSMGFAAVAVFSFFPPPTAWKFN